jgi:Helix-turn-helix domain
MQSAIDIQGETPSHLGAPVVDDSSCLRFFLEPDDTLHRRYEALRAYFVQRRPLQEIATQFGYTYDTLRQVVHQFRTQCRSGSPPPFSPPRAPDVRPTPPTPIPTCPRRPTEDA